jgi:uncharacterized damage-inducible protein DinB
MKIKKMSVILLTITLFFIFLGSSPLMAGKEALKRHWQSISGYYLEAAKLMPEEHFGFKPTEEIFSYAQQLLHVAGANFYFAAMVKGDKSPKPKEAFDAEGKSKKEVVATLKESFDYTLKVIESLSEDKIKSEVDFAKQKISVAHVLLFGCEHAIHHRGQMIIYLRLKGIKPPKYRTGYLK